MEKDKLEIILLHLAEEMCEASQHIFKILRWYGKADITSRIFDLAEELGHCFTHYHRLNKELSNLDICHDFNLMVNTSCEAKAMLIEKNEKCEKPV